MIITIEFLNDSRLVVTMYYIFIFWFVYSFFGWIMETIYTSIPKKAFQDRGFLTMPIIPIYGFGAMIAVVLLKPVSDNLFLVFLLGIFCTSLLEYVTSYLMEKLFHMRWWDYSDKKFNIHGRICLRNSFLFGVLSVALIQFIHPFLSKFVYKTPEDVLNQVAAVLMGLVILDFLHSILFSFKFSKVFGDLELTQKGYQSSRADTLLRIEGSFMDLKARVHQLEHRILKKYPKLKDDLVTMLEEIKKNIDS